MPCFRYGVPGSTIRLSPLGVELSPSAASQRRLSSSARFLRVRTHLHPKGLGESEYAFHGGARPLEGETAPEEFGMAPCAFEGVQSGAVEELDAGQIERHSLRMPVQR